jgi:hypothetical protein
MARLAMDTRAQNSWKEQVEKEAMTRILCKINKEEYKDEDAWFDKSKYTKDSKPVLPFATKINYPPKLVRTNPTQQALELTKQLRESGTNLLSDMRKPEEKVTKLLFDGFTKEEKGRYQYLKARKSDNPEEKYDYPLLTSFDYGWKLSEVAPAYKTPVNGRTKIVEDTFHRRNGVFPSS